MALANQPAKAPTADLAEGLSGPAASPTASIMAGDAPIAIPQASLLFDAEFVRSGNDLTLAGHDGQELLIADYFGAGAPDLIAPNHAMLDGHTVTLLAGPQFPGQYAQAGGATQAAEPIGSVETLQGTVTAQRADGTTHQLKVGDPVFESDVVTTGPGSNIGMKLADGTLVTLQESGKLAINEFVYQADGADNSALLNVIQGTFSLFAGQIAPTGDMQIKTPIATMGIRGTSILGVNVDAILGRLSLTQDPDGHVGFIEIFNNQNGNLFTVLRTVFEKITISESGLLSLTPKTPEELGIDQTLTELLHNFYNQVPQQGPDTSPQPQTGSPRFETPNIQEIIFDPAGPQDGTELLLPQELLEQFLESLLGIKEIRDEIILALTEEPSAGSVVLDDQPEGEGGDTGAGEGGGTIETTLPFDFGSSGPGSVGFAALDEQPVRSPGPDGNPVTADGQPVASGGVQLVYSWDAGSNTLFAMAGNEVIFTITVVPTTGAVEVKIIGAVDHLEQFGNGEFLSIDVPFTVQAANGQTATGTLTVVVGDDVPAFSNPDGVAPGVSNAEVDEDDSGAEQGDSADGTLKVDFGADGFGETAFTGAFEVPNAGSGALVAGGEGVNSGLTSSGHAILFRLSADGQTIEGYVPGENGQEQVILRATLDGNDAGYEVELLGNIDHQPPNDTNNRDEAQSLNFTVAAKDGDGDPIEATLSVRITDDAPVASNDLATVQNGGGGEKNLVIMIDVSGSMGDSAGLGDGTTRLDLAKQAAINLINGTNLANVMVVAFAGFALPNLPFWTGDKADAAEFISNLEVGSVNGVLVGESTDYDLALLEARILFEAEHQAADSTGIYFFSDGGDDLGWFEDGWNHFLDQNDIDEVVPVGVGEGLSGSEIDALDTVGYNHDPVVIDDQFDLVNTISGNVLTVDSGDGVDDFGADGGEGIASLVIDGETFTPGQDGNVLDEMTDQGGRLLFDFDTGAWEYLPPGNESLLPYENFRYTIKDGDGDISTASLTVVIDPERIDEVILGDAGDNVLGADPNGLVDGQSEWSQGGSEAQGYLSDNYYAPPGDLLVGGLGKDTFVLDNFAVTDFIADYEIGEEDVIDLSALLDGVTADNYESFVRIDDQGDGAVDVLQVNTGTEQDPSFVDVAKLHGDAGVDIIVNDGSTQHVTNPDHIA